MIFILTLISFLIRSTLAEDKVWAVLGRPLSLSCQSEDENCFWLNPDRKVFDRSTFEQAAKFSDVAGSSCDIEIGSVEEKDIGAWTCLAGNRMEEVLDVSLALEPGSVHLETVSDSEIRCVVAGARPRPKFDWYLDDVLMEDINAKDFQDIDLHYQSLFLSPDTSNKNLRCVISHVSLQTPKEASLIINFKSGNGPKSGGSSGIDIFVGFFALAILGAFFVVVLAWAKNWKIFHKEEQRADSGNEMQTSSIQNSRFFVTRLSEVSLIQNADRELTGIRIS